MLAFIVTTIVCFIIYLLLTIGSATGASDFFNLGLWSNEEILFGVILSVIVGAIGRKIFVKKDFRMLNPVRWFTFLFYLFIPFFGVWQKRILMLHIVL